MVVRTKPSQHSAPVMAPCRAVENPACTMMPLSAAAITTSAMKEMMKGANLTTADLLAFSAFRISGVLPCAAIHALLRVPYQIAPKIQAAAAATNSAVQLCGCIMVLLLFQAAHLAD